MVFMAISRFSSDRVIEKIGMQKSYYLSAILIVLGIATVILLPYFWPALVGFSLIGLGTAAVIPMIFISCRRFYKIFCRNGDFYYFNLRNFRTFIRTASYWVFSRTFQFKTSLLIIFRLRNDAYPVFKKPI